MCRICDLNSTDPTQETCPTVDHADYLAPTRQHEVDHALSGIDLSCLADLYHQAGIDYLSEVCNSVLGVRHLFCRLQEKWTQWCALGAH